jgi:hypothetical protein
MTRLQTPTAPQAQQLLPQQIQPLGFMAGPIQLSQWDNYGFTIPRSTIAGWIAKSRVNGIMREGAVLRFGQRYYVDPQRLDAWMHGHSEGTRLTRPKRRRDEDKEKGGETRTARPKQQKATTDGEGQKAKRTLHRGNLNPGKPSLSDDQVKEIRQRAAQTPEENRLKLYAELAAKFGGHQKVVQECAEGRTYKRLPLTSTYKQAGKRKSKTESQAASAAEPG